MGLLSVLGSIGSIAAAPFTGGTSLAWLPAALGAAGGLGEVLSHGAASAAAGRRGDAALQVGMNAQNNTAQLNAAKFNLQAPDARYGQVAKGDLANNVQDVGEIGSGRDLHFTGGLRPSALGPASHQAASEMQRQALMALMTGSDQQHPQMSTIPDSGLMEKIGGIAGLTGGLAGAVGPYLPPKIATMQKYPTPDWTPPAWDPEQVQE